MKRFYILTTYVEDIFLGIYDDAEKLKETIKIFNDLYELHIYVYDITESGIIAVNEIDGDEIEERFLNV